ncbi:FAD-binding protein [Thermomicrobiaceae bacterium CFH 74404]|uniref:FAD-binding protein n=1 Tax=Thermalbibacter longus TaxID=2951981 RepID=A0AA41WAR0_9BACT|nr:FAD-binding protein [Thermalbibacter longus]MCM8748947.1 FAD-binding protein [Thermalbibacter longus]
MTRHWRQAGTWHGYSLDQAFCDVLIIGGGFAGLLAARAAARQSMRTLVVSKGFAGADGVSAFAGGVVLYLLPEDDREAFQIEHSRLSEGLSHPEAVRRVAEANMQLLGELTDAGAPVERTPEGRPRRRWLPAAGRRYVPRLGFPSTELARFLRQEALRAGARVLDQTIITRLQRTPNGGFWAVGFRRQEGMLVAIRAKAVVLAAGGCSWRGAHMGQHNVLGEGLALGLDAGARFLGMEFCTSYLATCSLFDTHGQDVLAALGGRLRNRVGEDILERHGIEHPAPPHLTAFAMLTELRAGRGPIHFDLRGVPPAAREDWETQFHLVARGLHRTGVDIFEHPVVWLPGFTGSIAGGGGVRTLDLAGTTEVPGLFAAGDAAARLALVGAGSGITFLNVAWALVSGHWAGLAAARHAAGEELSATGVDELLRGLLETTVRPLCEPAPAQTGTLDQLLRHTQMLAVDPERNFFRTPERLQEADAQLDACWERLHSTTVNDWHNLGRWYELRAMMLATRAMFHSALARQETRGWHRRLDYPERDPALEKVWLVAEPTSDPSGERLPDFTVWPVELDEPEAFRATACEEGAA